MSSARRTAALNQRFVARLTGSQLASTLKVLRDFRRPLQMPTDAPNFSALRYDTTRRRPWAIPARVDVYLPDGPGPHPSILWVHGGGFAVGQRDMRPMRVLTSLCRRAGYAVASIDYRMLLRGGGLEQGLEDTLQAWRWWQAQAAQFNLDPQRMALGGLSAGGCLSLLAAQRALDEGGAPRCVISSYTLYDLGDAGGPFGRLLFRMAGGAGAAQRSARSPVGQPVLALPTLVLHGDADAIVPVRQAEGWVAQRRRAKLPTEVLILPGAPHAFFNHPETEAAQRGAQALLDYLEAQLGPAPD